MDDDVRTVRYTAYKPNILEHGEVSHLLKGWETRSKDNGYIPP